MPQLKEVQSIEAVDGAKLFLSGAFYNPGFAGYGLPQVNYVRQKGYRQVGETVRDVEYGSRTISLNLFTKSNPSRADYWDERQRIFNIVRPNRGISRLNELTITVRREDGTKRFIKAFYAGGLELTDEDTDENAFRIQTTINFYCPSPIWFDSNTITITPSASVASSLVFPITFPITFSVSGSVFSTGIINYEGSFRSYPKITISGPYTTARITLAPGGEEIILINPINAGEQRIITLSETGFSIIDHAGDDQFNDLQIANLVNFFIKPSDQIATGETQSISTNLLNGVDGVSSVIYEYDIAYIGI